MEGGGGGGVGNLHAIAKIANFATEKTSSRRQDSQLLRKMPKICHEDFFQ